MNDNKFNPEKCLQFYVSGMSINRIACSQAWTREDVLNVVRHYNQSKALEVPR